MCDEADSVYEIDKRLEGYKTIFGHDWAKMLFSVSGGTKLQAPAMALCASWRAAVNTHIFPWAMMQSLHGLWDGVAKHKGPTPRLIAALAEALPKKMRSRMTVTAKQDLARAAREVASEVMQACDNDPDLDMTPEAFWQAYLDDPQCWELKLAIWGSQQLVFGSLFFAYEHYLTTLVGIGKPDTGKREAEYRPLWKQLVKDAKNLFDPIDAAIARTCLEDDFVEVARLTRNCLAHRGGKESEELKAKKHGITVSSKGIIQIMAPDNKIHLRGLEQRVLMITKAAVTLPQFTAPNPDTHLLPRAPGGNPCTGST